MSAGVPLPLQGSGRETASCTFSWFQSLVLGYSVPDWLSSQGLWCGLSFSSLTVLVFAYKTIKWGDFSSLDSSFMTFAKFLCQNWVLDTGSGQTSLGIHCWVYYHRPRISLREVSVCVLGLTFSSTKLTPGPWFLTGVTQISGKLTLTQQPKSVLITTGFAVLWNTRRGRGKKTDNPGEFLDCLQNKWRSQWRCNFHT